MALQLPNQQQIFKRGVTVLRTDIIKFAEDVQLISTAGPPSGQWEKGTLFFNQADKKLYASANYKAEFTALYDAWFKFDGSFTDSTANNHNITAVGNPGFLTGKYSKAVILDGSDDKLSIPTTLPLDEEQGFNISFWVYCLSSDKGTKYIFQRYNDSDNFFIITLIDTGSDLYVRFDYESGGVVNETYNFTNERISYDTWTHVRIRYSGGTTFSVWTDGTVETKAITALGDMGFTTETFDIGYDTPATSYGTSFYLDDLKITIPDNDTATANDIYNADANHWASYPGTFVEAT